MKRSWWGWGWEDQAVDGTALHAIAGAISTRPGFESLDGKAVTPPSPDDLGLRPPRIAPPASLASFCASDAYARASHTYGKAFRDVVRALEGDVREPPDVVAFPGDEQAVVDLLDWCAASNVVAIPYGGGSSVVGGVEARGLSDAYAGVVCIDMTKLDRVVEIDTVSRAARIQGGALGPVLEEQLRPHGYTLRHFPQSFEFSTLGGWLATRSGGHYATVYTHIDDLVEAMRVVTPAGVVESRRLPGSGAGPSPDRMFLGSEGTLGIVTEAWMRVQERVRFKASASVLFATFEAAAQACRAVSQSALFPTNCRVLDAGEATSAGVTDGSSVLLLGFESADHPVDAWIARAVELAADHGGTVPGGVKSSSTEGAAGAWRNSFIRAPYGRDALTRLGCVVDTFETACTWDAFPAFHASVVDRVGAAVREVCGGGTITCRFTHTYPDGPAPYYTVIAPGRRGSQLQQWDDVKAAAMEAVVGAGGTVTHHHAVGRDHRPGYDRQRPDVFADVLRAAKATLDPVAILNPGVVFDPR
ncbi:MAG TPA: FAD-binding oxidoreductase [Acidimicrobiales bacterium]